MSGLIWSFLLAGVGIAGLWLAGSERWVGWAIGILAQVAWAVYALATHQYGFLLSSAGYAFVYSRNLLRWKFAADSQVEVESVHLRTLERVKLLAGLSKKP